VRALTLALCVVSLGASASDVRLAKAQDLVKRLKYQDAVALLETLEADPTLPLADYRLVLELSGVVQGTLRRPAKATDAFKRLLVVTPGHELSGSYPPRVMTPYYQAKSWLDEVGALQLERRPPTVNQGLVTGVVVALKSDPLTMASAVRLHTRADGAAWKVEARPAGDELTFAVSGRKVEWWAELLTSTNRVVLELGSETAPLVEVVAPVVEAAPPARALEPAATMTATASQSEGTHPLKTVGSVTAGLGAAALISAAVFGASSMTARSSFAGAAVNEDGVTTMLTRTQALALSQQAQLNAFVANILFVVGGGLLAGGVTSWLIGARLTVVPTTTGVVAMGTLP
jgi:hypothetical protein